MMLRLLVAAVTLFCVFQPASAQDDPQSKDFIAVFDDVHFEIANCAAYYAITQQCFSGSDKQSESYRKEVDAIIGILNKASFEIGSKIGMTQDAMLSRFKMVLDEHKKHLAGSCVNLSSLYVRHANRCKQVAENPMSIVSEYMAKRSKVQR
jgi:hypothetical protein